MYLRTVIGTVMFAAVSVTAFAAQGEFKNQCVTGLSLKQHIKTDCSINAKAGDKTYCFGNKEAKTMYMKDPTDTVKKALVFWAASKEK